MTLRQLQQRCPFISVIGENEGLAEKGEKKSQVVSLFPKRSFIILALLQRRNCGACVLQRENWNIFFRRGMVRNCKFVAAEWWASSVVGDLLRAPVKNKKIYSFRRRGDALLFFSFFFVHVGIGIFWMAGGRTDGLMLLKGHGTISQLSESGMEWSVTHPKRWI